MHYDVYAYNILNKLDKKKMYASRKYCWLYVCIYIVTNNTLIYLIISTTYIMYIYKRRKWMIKYIPLSMQYDQWWCACTTYIGIIFIRK